MYRSFWIRNIEVVILFGIIAIPIILIQIIGKPGIIAFIRDGWAKDGSLLSKLLPIGLLFLAIAVQVFFIGMLVGGVLWVVDWFGRRFVWLRWLHNIENWADSKLGLLKSAWLLKPAARGDVRAQMALGELYEQGLGVAQNYDEARHWYRVAALQGVRDAQMKLGSMYWQGLGIPRDQSEALRWYREAAARGDATGQTIMGDLAAGYITDASTGNCED
jgi:hypothetical protein